MAKSLKGALHAHGCVRCHTRYQDACEHLQDRLCTACRGGRVWSQLIENRSPQDCCISSARLARKDEVQAYSLTGGHLWFICPACKRTHPFNPRSTP